MSEENYQTKTVCENCGKEAEKQTEFCPSCGTEKPWTEKPRYDMENVDFPVIVEVEHYNDNPGLWRDFCEQEFGWPELTSKDIANMPENLPSMKYNVVYYYMVIGREKIEGPFLEKSEAEKTREKLKNK